MAGGLTLTMGRVCKLHAFHLARVCTQGLQQCQDQVRHSCFGGRPPCTQCLPSVQPKASNHIAHDRGCIEGLCAGPYKLMLAHTPCAAIAPNDDKYAAARGTQRLTSRLARRMQRVEQVPSDDTRRQHHWALCRRGFVHFRELRSDGTCRRQSLQGTSRGRATAPACGPPTECH